MPSLAPCRLAGTELAVSPLVLGSAWLGLRQSEQEVHALLDQYVEFGGNLIDTARIYSDWEPGEIGRSERIIGDWLRARGGTRGEVMIATKGMHYHFTDPARNRVYPEAARKDLEESLRTLGLERIELYWLHRDNPMLPVNEVVDFMQPFFAEGKIRYMGASNWTTERIAAANEYATSAGLHGFVASQILYNLGCWHLRPLPDPTLVAMDRPSHDYHRKTQMPVFAYSPQAMGFFSKVIEQGARPDELPDRFHATPGNAAFAPKIAALARSKGCSVNAIVLAYLLHQPVPVFPVIGPDRPDHLVDSISALDVSLAAPELQMLEDAAGSGIRHG